VKKLQAIERVLQKALEIVTSERVPWDELPVSGSDSERNEKEGETELGQLAQYLAACNAYLERRIEWAVESIDRSDAASSGGGVGE
jgi:hypothetical protein